MPITSPGGAAQRSSAAILLLEDNVLVRMPLGEYLRDCGYRVLEATTFAEAEALLRAGIRVDLVFTKVRLAGGRNGFTLANWLRRNHPGIKVLLAASVAHAAEKAGDLCASGPTPSPEHHGTVLRRIQQLLHQARRTGGGSGKDNVA